MLLAVSSLDAAVLRAVVALEAPVPRVLGSLDDAVSQALC